MLYDTSKSIDLQRMDAKYKVLRTSGAVIELTKKVQRTPKQNNYLHLILTWFAIESGNSIEYVKQNYFKKLCNPSIFITVKDDKHLGKVEVLRSSSQVSTAEMTTAIERFRNWASDNGIYLPDAENKEFLKHIQIESEKYKDYI